MSRVRIGLVGAGLIARVAHLPLLQALDDRFELVAIADPDDLARARTAARFGIPRAVADHRALLADGGVDALLVCSPNATHAEVVLEALDAGVHVLVEKPLCLSIEDADRIVAARDRTGLVVQVGYMKRFDPAYEALADALTAPHELLHVATATHDPWLPRHFGETPEPPPVLDLRSDTIFGALVHDVNAVHGLLELGGIAAPLVLTDASARSDGYGVAATAAITGGARWTMTWLLIPAVEAFNEEIAIYTDHAVHRLSFPAPYALHAPTTYARDAGGERRLIGAWDEAYRRQLVHFHDCVTRAERCRTPPEQARADIELLTRIHEVVR